MLLTAVWLKAYELLVQRITLPFFRHICSCRNADIILTSFIHCSFTSLLTQSLFFFSRLLPTGSKDLALFHFLALCIFISLTQNLFFLLHPIPSSSLHDVFLWNIARCTVTHSDARTLRTLSVWDYQRAPNTTSRLILRQLCVRMGVVLWWGVWCAQLRVIIWWWTRAGKTFGLRSSGHAAQPQPANQHRVPEVGKVERTYDGTLWYSVTRRPHQISQTPGKFLCILWVNPREPLVLPSCKS